jgi:hypothetical protein
MVQRFWGKVNPKLMHYQPNFCFLGRDKNPVDLGVFQMA